MKAIISQLQKMEINVGQPIILVIMLIVLLFMGTNFYYVSLHEGYDEQYRNIVAEQQLLTQRMAKSVQGSAILGVNNIALLRESRGIFEQNLTILEKGDEVTNLPPSPAEVETELQAVQTLWKKIRENANMILAADPELKSIRELVKNLEEQFIPATLTQIDDLVKILVEKNPSIVIFENATRLRVLLQRIADRIERLLLVDGADATRAANEFARDMALLIRIGDAFQKGDDLLQIKPLQDPEARDKSSQLIKASRALKEPIDQLLSKKELLFKIQAATGQIVEQTEVLLDNCKKLRSAYARLGETRLFSRPLGYLLAALAFILLITLGWSLLSDLHQRQLESEKQQQLAAATSRRNQEAILRLLDEITTLADGDLTVRATVTEDFTGAIADSINFAVDALRDLVAAINSTTLQVSGAAQETQATAVRLTDASEHQSQEIRRASSTVTTMAQAMGQMATQADDAVAVAQNSVTTAKQGAEAVRDTIKGMGAIREQIQDTSKRIKRLGESSQEISEILNLINDISDQTNILALNAAIQAAMAGEAGRGFAVVADEVQRLAERAGNATKQIDALVRTIQSDTNEAATSMERTTTDVVRGTQLAEEAGRALAKIDNVSAQLAELIHHISQSIQGQARSATNISTTMNVIQEITTQTSTGTQETAASIGHLADLSNELGRSVAGFKLPDTI